jgi:ribosomal protein S6--L-glutamate ligase
MLSALGEGCMVKTLILVNGENFWADYFEEYSVYQVRLQTSRWLLRDGILTVYDTALGKAIRVDSVLWRLGAVRPFPGHRAALELVRYAGIPCINNPDTLLRSYDRLSMLNELRAIGLPVVPFTAVIGPHLISELQPELPVVIKVGNYHAGYGKMLISTHEQWQDMKDFIHITEDYFVIEPFIDYKTDIRCLAVGEQVWALMRNGSHWKANVGYVDTQLIPAPDPLYEYTLRAMRHFGADILGLDFLQTHDGEYVLLESNSVPGLTGFPSAVIDAVAARMHEKLNTERTSG